MMMADAATVIMLMLLPQLISRLQSDYGGAGHVLAAEVRHQRAEMPAFHVASKLQDISLCVCVARNAVWHAMLHTSCVFCGCQLV